MALWVLLGMIFLIPPAWWAVGQIELHNDVENWLPSEDPQSQILTWYREQFPVENRVLVSWKGSSLNDPRVWRLAERLEGRKDANGIRRGGLPYVEEVVTPHDVIARITEDRAGPDVGANEAIRRVEGVFVGMGKLKLELTAAGLNRKKTVERVLAERIRDELGLEVQLTGPQTMDTVEFREEDAERPIQEFPEPDVHHVQLSWRGMKAGTAPAAAVKQLALSLRGRRTEQYPEGEPWVKSAFFFPGSPVAMYVTLSDAGEEEPDKAFAAMREAAEDVGIPLDEFHMGGRAVAGTELNEQVKRSAWNRAAPWFLLHRRSPLLLSLVVGIALSFLMLRSVRLALLVLMSAVYTVLITVALVPLTDGSMNMVLVVMPTLLYVLTISAAIHVANYWKHAAYQDRRTAVVEAVKTARLPCILAATTTAIGLLSLATSPLRPVRDFGLYSAVGCLVSLVVVLVCLPALLQFWPARRPESGEIERPGWRGLGSLIVRHWVPISSVSVIVFAGCVVGLRWFRTETKVIRYFPEETRVVQDYHDLEDNLAGIIPVDVVVRFDKTALDNSNILERIEIVREIEEKLRKHPEISGVISLPDFRPVHQPLPEDATPLQRMKYNRTVYTTEQKTKQAEARAKRFLTTSGKEMELHLDDGRRFTVSEGDELWRVTAQVAIMSDANYSELLDTLNGIVQSSLKYQPGGDHVITGMVPVFLRTQQAVLESLITSFALAFAVIAVVMMIVLRNPVSGLITMVPNLMPVGIVFGLVSWGGMAVDIGTMITASVALGIAVDGTLHLLTWFRKGIAAGQSRRDAIQNALAHCGPAMWQTSTAVGIGLLMLAPAELLLINRFGLLMASLIGAALLADVVFLPALLSGPLGYIIERGIRKSPGEPVFPAETTDDASQAPPETKRGDENHMPPAAAAKNNDEREQAASSSTSSTEPHIVKLQSSGSKDTGRILRLD